MHACRLPLGLEWYGHGSLKTVLLQDRERVSRIHGRITTEPERGQQCLASDAIETTETTAGYSQREQWSFFEGTHHLRSSYSEAANAIPSMLVLLTAVLCFG